MSISSTLDTTIEQTEEQILDLLCAEFPYTRGESGRMIYGLGTSIYVYDRTWRGHNYPPLKEARGFQSTLNISFIIRKTEYDTAVKSIVAASIFLIKKFNPEAVLTVQNEAVIFAYRHGILTVCQDPNELYMDLLLANISLPYSLVPPRNLD